VTLRPGARTREGRHPADSAEKEVEKYVPRSVTWQHHGAALYVRSDIVSFPRDKFKHSDDEED